ncbi:UDP-glycosyltransferase 79B30-like [Chenopodium quinoa]|uniref:Glycosyltransferase n=1 Tax=Chenopodium quinoa TaxID=63459 RepID=A0A803LQJ3_CHEQI|nr:UDP-glycosyltransferase 79B30-like [Chenopodium quinoa]
MSNNKNSKILKVAFYPWYAFGHLIPNLRLANQLAERGHQISFFLPSKIQTKLASYNHHPDHISFIPIDIPHVDGLPPGAGAANNVPASALTFLMRAMDMTRDTMEDHLLHVKPDIVFYDFTCWMPELARKHGIKAVYFCQSYVMTFAYFCPFKRKESNNPTAADLVAPPPGFPSQSIWLRAQEAADVEAAPVNTVYGPEHLTLLDRVNKSLRECDAIGAKSFKELEGAYCEYVEKVYGKPVLLAGPLITKLASSKLDERIHGWLQGFDDASVIYCALGSECVMNLNHFQHLLLGLELTGRPFFVVLRPPTGYRTIESAFPKGIEERTKGRGMMHGGWVQQQLILQHPSVGCFVTHSGPGSISEAMISSECQLVLLPQILDQYLIARMMSLELKVGIEVEECTKEAISKAISTVMDGNNDVAKEVRANRVKWRKYLLREGPRLEESYISSFIYNLQKLLE